MSNKMLVENFTILYRIDGKVYQAAIPDKIYQLLARQNLALLDEFGGTVVPNTDLFLEPKKDSSLHFSVSNSNKSA